MTSEGRKLIFLDIDGTLTDRADHVPRSARKACLQARAKGHRLYIATGRARTQISAAILSLGFDGVISSAGACIEAGETFIFRAFLAPPLLERLLGFLEANRAPYLLELPGKVMAKPAYFSSLEQTLSKWMLKDAARETIRSLRDRLAPWDAGFDREQVFKVVFRESDALRYKDAEREFRAECEIFRHSIPLFGMGGAEITPPGVNKGTAARRVTEFHGMDREDTIALGDGDNDRPMLEYAGIGIAMGNGDEGLKQAADDVTGWAKQGGLARAFKKYGLARPD